MVCDKIYVLNRFSKPSIFPKPNICSKSSLNYPSSVCWSLQAVTLRCSVKKVLLEISQKLTGKHLRQSLFFNKVAGPATFIKKETLAQVFSC